VGPAVALTAATVVGGLWPSAYDQLAHGHLAIWHGVNAALVLTALILTLGAVVFASRRRVAPILAVGRRIPSAADAYLGLLRGLNALADRVTAITQPGSLPIYAGVILLTAAVAPLWALTTGPGWPGFPATLDTPAHLPVIALVLSAALAASVVRRRFSAALVLGVTGYAMAGLFVVQGAPDLALTQVAIETLSTVLFVLVLRRLPDRFGWTGVRDSRMTAYRRGLRLGVAAIVGVSVFVLAITMSAPRPSTPVSDEMIERAVPDGGGQNVVNVILVDFRGFDTLGEITVLVSAAIGAVALARAGRRPGPRSDAAPVEREAAPGRTPTRLVNLDVSVRVVFAAVMVGSIYLLFAGHSQPGGGFVGGILAGAAVSLQYLAGGIGNVRRLSRARPWTVLGSGLILAAGTATAPLLAGQAVLTSSYAKLHPPLLGTIKLSTATAFDIGVYLVVLGLALMVFESFGDEPVPT
ncbi:MAG: hydrogen gas-evolving membrane-bound hydrogenase subunit E, partial [Aquihabitans sp.]